MIYCYIICFKYYLCHLYGSYLFMCLIDVIFSQRRGKSNQMCETEWRLRVAVSVLLGCFANSIIFVAPVFVVWGIRLWSRDAPGMWGCRIRAKLAVPPEDRFVISTRHRTHPQRHTTAASICSGNPPFLIRVPTLHQRHHSDVKPTDSTWNSTAVMVKRQPGKIIRI